jgi:hypothetical protein
MVSSVGWEAFAPLTGRFRDLACQLPCVIGVTLQVTTAVSGILAISERAARRVPGDHVLGQRRSDLQLLAVIAHSAGVLQPADRCGRRVGRKIGPSGQAPRQQVVRL